MQWWSDQHMHWLDKFRFINWLFIISFSGRVQELPRFAPSAVTRGLRSNCQEYTTLADNYSKNPDHYSKDENSVRQKIVKAISFSPGLFLAFLISNLQANTIFGAISLLKNWCTTSVLSYYLIQNVRFTCTQNSFSFGMHALVYWDQREDFKLKCKILRGICLPQNPFRNLFNLGAGWKWSSLRFGIGGVYKKKYTSFDWNLHDDAYTTNQHSCRSIHPRSWAHASQVSPKFMAFTISQLFIHNFTRRIETKSRDELDCHKIEMSVHCFDLDWIECSFWYCTSLQTMFTKTMILLERRVAGESKHSYSVDWIILGDKARFLKISEDWSLVFDYSSANRLCMKIGRTRSIHSEAFVWHSLNYYQKRCKQDTISYGISHRLHREITLRSNLGSVACHFFLGNWSKPLALKSQWSFQRVAVIFCRMIESRELAAKIDSSSGLVSFEEDMSEIELSKMAEKIDQQLQESMHLAQKIKSMSHQVCISQSFLSYSHIGEIQCPISLKWILIYNTPNDSQNRCKPKSLV